MKLIIVGLLILIVATAGFVIYINRESLFSSELPKDSAIAYEIRSDDVKNHASATDCWVAIGGSVYRLDNYFVRSPNSTLAEQLCGKIEPTINLPSNLKKDTLTTYRIGLLAL